MDRHVLVALSLFALGEILDPWCRMREPTLYAASLQARRHILGGDNEERGDEASLWCRCSAMTFVGITIIAFFLLGLCGNPSRVLYTGVRQRVQPCQLSFKSFSIKMTEAWGTVQCPSCICIRSGLLAAWYSAAGAEPPPAEVLTRCRSETCPATRFSCSSDTRHSAGSQTGAPQLVPPRARGPRTILAALSRCRQRV